ncbi:Cell division protein ZapD [Saliniradius amylolyticus]|uniref:Cell division protein ZapD n=1 Tax=Saliniradius amylolyticus TaxID=2183582 RepID=A0A2S2E5H8_9ALTE|nr:cell division protein ZapD [Saliniradius amylolyticus]AWL12911.1 Cell division protein ZapD [Saliniradius amylolyticus]
MNQAVFEFPLNEKVRTYLRLEQLFKQLNAVERAEEDWQYIGFLEVLFTLLDLVERVDLRTDMLKDMDRHEKNLVHWSKHPNIDNDALQSALKRVLALRSELANARKVGSNLKEDKFLMSIRQRFSIPGATCSFDLPNLLYWLRQPQEQKQQEAASWIAEFGLMQTAMDMTLTFLRERGKFTSLEAEKGFYQGTAEDKVELIRLYCATDQGYYPTLSGNKYRYIIRFIRFEPDADGKVSVDNTVRFQFASC